MSSGSNPVTTIGTPNRSTSGGYSSVPITLHTCPAARKACTRQLGDCMIASIAGGTRTCDTSMLKFRTPSRCAWYTAIAFGGAVVSNPMPKNTTPRSGFARARVSASSGRGRAVHHLDLRQQLVGAVPDDRVGVPAADLHDRPRAGRRGVDVVDQAAGQFRVVELVEVLHRAVLPSASALACAQASPNSL